MNKINWQSVKEHGVPVFLGFTVVGLILAFIKSRFGIEIGDPADLGDEENTNPQPEEV